MGSPRVHVSRWKVGLVTLGCFVGALVVLFVWPERETLLGALIRVGLLMAAVWIAMPSRDREAAWANVSRTTFAAGLLVALALVFPKLRMLLLGLLPVFVALGSINHFLKGAEKKRPERPSERR